METKLLLIIGMLIIFPVGSIHAIWYSPLVITSVNGTSAYQGFIGEPIIFQYALTNDELEPLDFELQFNTWESDDTLIDQEIIPIHLKVNETKMIDYQFIPKQEGNFITNVFSDIYPMPNPVTYAVLDDSKSYQHEKITIQSDSAKKGCATICVEPESLTIDVGTVVEWENTSSGITVIQTGMYREDSKGISFSSDQRLTGVIYPNATFSFLFLEKGNYKYYFSDHRFLQYAGNIQVVDNEIKLPIFDGTKHCNIKEDITNAQSLLEGDKIINAFIRKYPDAYFDQSFMVDESSPPQTTVFYHAESATLSVRIVGYDGEQCFVPFSYGFVDVHNNGKVFYKNDVQRAVDFFTMHPSPLKQFESGIPIHEILCNEHHVLVERPNETVACVYPSTAEKLQWKLVNPAYVSTSVFEVIKDDTIFDVKYHIKGGIVEDITYTNDSKSLLITINSTSDGKMTIDLPRNLIDAKADYCPPIKPNPPDDRFFVLLDGEEVMYDEILTTSEKRTLQIPFNENTDKIEIIAACLI